MDTAPHFNFACQVSGCENYGTQRITKDTQALMVCYDHMQVHHAQHGQSFDAWYHDVVQRQLDPTDPVLPHIVPKQIIMPPHGAERLSRWLTAPVAAAFVSIGWCIVFLANPFYAVQQLQEQFLLSLEAWVPLEWKHVQVWLVRQRLAQVDLKTLHRLPPAYRAYLEACVSILYWQPRSYRAERLYRLLQSYVTVCGRRPDAVTARIRASVHIRIMTPPPLSLSPEEAFYKAKIELAELGCGTLWYRSPEYTTQYPYPLNEEQRILYNNFPPRSSLKRLKPKPDLLLLQTMTNNLELCYTNLKGP